MEAGLAVMIESFLSSFYFYFKLFFLFTLIFFYFVKGGDVCVD